jgi:hypothetical protein
VVRAVVLALALALLTASVVAADSFPILGNRYAPSGVGWRLVSEVQDSLFRAYQVRVARDRSAFGTMWQKLGWDDRGRTDFAGVPPWLAVNFEREIVVLFSVGINSCTDSVQLDDVVIDRSTRTVHSVTSYRAHCGNLDLSGAITFVVALDRGRLPPSPFTLQLHAEPTCGSCSDPDDRMTVVL